MTWNRHQIGGFVGFLVLSCSAAFSQSTHSIALAEATVLGTVELHIRVLDRQNLGARVLVDLHTDASRIISAYSDWSGNVTFQGLVPGSYVAVIKVAGENIYRHELQLPAGQKVTSKVVRLPNVIATLDAGHVSQNNLRAPAKANKSFLQGVAGIRSGNLEEALQHFEEALKIYPAYSESCNGRGVVLHMMNRSDEAEEAFRAAIRFDPKSFEPRYNLGKLLLERNRPAEAKAELQTAFDLDDENITTAELLIDSMLMMHDTKSAISAATSLHQRGLRHPAHIHLQIASELENQGMTEAASEQDRLVGQDEPSAVERQETGRTGTLFPGN